MTIQELAYLLHGRQYTLEAHSALLPPEQRLREPFCEAQETRLARLAITRDALKSA